MRVIGYYGNPISTLIPPLHFLPEISAGNNHGLISRRLSSSSSSSIRPLPSVRALTAMDGAAQVPNPVDAQAHRADAHSSSMKLLFVEMGVDYDQHGQDVNAAAMRACRDAITSNSIPAFRIGSIPGISFEQMKLKIKLGVPHNLQKEIDIEKVKSVFPYGKILGVETVDGGLICSSGVCLEAIGDKNDDCYVVNAAVYVGY